MERMWLIVSTLCLLAAPRLPLAAAARQGASALEAGASRSLQQACAPGFYLYGVTCTRCGYGYWCAGGTAPRTPCNMFQGTQTDVATSASDCRVVTCNPCSGDAPDVLMSTGMNAVPQNGLWRVTQFVPGPDLIPEFLCAVESTNGAMVGDLTVLYTGDVLFVDTQCNLRYLPSAAYDLLAQTEDLSLPCGTQFLMTLSVPSGVGCTGLTVGFKSNLLFISTDSGDVATMEVNVTAAGKLTSKVVSWTSVACDPLANRPRSTGGTDMTPGPDGNMYRWIAKDSQAAYVGTRFGVAPSTSYMTNSFSYVNRQLFNGSSTVDRNFANAGAFCTATGVFGTGTRAWGQGDGRAAYFFSFGLGRPSGMDPAALPPAHLVAYTASIDWPDGLRVNGAAATRPLCGGPDLVPVVAAVSLQVKWPDCVATPRSLPQVTLTRRQPLPSATLCTVQNTVVITDSVALLDPPPPTSVCSSLMPLDTAAKYSVEAQPVPNMRLSGVTCFTVVNGVRTSISKPDGTISVPPTGTPITCVAEYVPSAGSNVLPGYYRPTPGSPQCEPCGFGYACPGGDETATRYLCEPRYLGTPTTTSATCQPVPCSPCTEETPMVVFTTGPGGEPANGVYVIRQFINSSALVPEFLCALKSINSPGVGDIAILHTNDVLIVDLPGTVWYIAADAMASMMAAPNVMTRNCPLTRSSLRLPALEVGLSYTGLSPGFASNVLLASTNLGHIFTIELNQDPAAAYKLGSKIVSRTIIACDPAASVAGTAGGTDLTAAPDGSIYRWCAKDVSTRYAATRLFVNETSRGRFNGTSGYTNRGLLNNADTVTSNAGAFCTAYGAIGTGYNNQNGGAAVFYQFGGRTFSAPPWTDLPLAVEVARTVPVVNLRINGAASRPVCGYRVI